MLVVAYATVVNGYKPSLIAVCTFDFSLSREVL